MEFKEEDYLQLSGLQHFAFLPPPDAVNTMLSFAPAGS